jgi:PPOX class probable F420-dependent enzyme
MDLADALAFATDHRHGVIVTLKSDGRPQLSNIAYALVDGVFSVSITDDRAKTRNLRRDPRTSLHVTRADFYAYVVFEGDTQLSPVAASPDDDTVDQLVEYYRAVGGEHPNWDEYRRAMVTDRRLVARFTPERAYGML